jgi:cytochrome c-type biogenesis protein CcmH/NrfG
MTLSVRIRSMSRPGFLVLALVLLCAAARPLEAAPLSADKAPAAALKRDSARCRSQADVGACYDAIRWNPGDPALLVSLADALVRAQRPADAIRNYRRAAALAPNMPGVAAKISAVEAKMSSRRARPGDRAGGAAGKRYSNAAPETQSH